jgi:hypothetical protein
LKERKRGVEKEREREKSEKERERERVRERKISKIERELSHLTCYSGCKERPYHVPKMYNIFSKISCN